MYEPTFHLFLLPVHAPLPPPLSASLPPHPHPLHLPPSPPPFSFLPNFTIPWFLKIWNWLVVKLKTQWALYSPPNDCQGMGVGRTPSAGHRSQR